MPSKKSPLETDIELECCDIASAEGCANLKMDRVKRGWPDRVFLLPTGGTMLIEFKRPGENPRPQQDHQHDLLKEIGHPVLVIDSVEQFRDLLHFQLDYLRP